MSRLIDADALIDELNSRIEAAIKWGVNAIADRDAEIKLRAEQAVATFCEASLTVKKMPTISPKVGKWIPVSERLPEEDEEVLVWLKEKDIRGKNIRIAQLGVHDVEDNNFEYIGKKAVWYCGIYYCDIEKVTAWMPLPEPYEEEVTE